MNLQHGSERSAGNRCQKDLVETKVMLTRKQEFGKGTDLFGG